jgi:hypothetical protein
MPKLLKEERQSLFVEFTTTIDTLSGLIEQAGYEPSATSLVEFVDEIEAVLNTDVPSSLEEAFSDALKHLRGLVSKLAFHVKSGAGKAAKAVSNLGKKAKAGALSVGSDLSHEMELHHAIRAAQAYKKKDIAGTASHIGKAEKWSKRAAKMGDDSGQLYAQARGVNMSRPNRPDLYAASKDKLKTLLPKGGFDIKRLPRKAGA